MGGMRWRRSTSASSVRHDVNNFGFQKVLAQEELAGEKCVNFILVFHLKI